MGGEPYVVISADCHGGGNIRDYRPYLESRYLDDFDGWAATYQNPFDDVAGDDGSRNWDSARRLRELVGRQVISPVLWGVGVRGLIDAGATSFLEAGVGDVLTKLMKRIDPGVVATAIGTPEAASSAAAAA